MLWFLAILAFYFLAFMIFYYKSEYNKRLSEAKKLQEIARKANIIERNYYDYYNFMLECLRNNDLEMANEFYQYAIQESLKMKELIK